MASIEHSEIFTSYLATLNAHIPLNPQRTRLFLSQILLCTHFGFVFVANASNPILIFGLLTNAW